MVFSGDHVMAWSTSIVAPPDGDVRLSRQPRKADCPARYDRAYWPGHGGPVADPRRFTRALLSPRRQREMQVLDALGKGPARIPQLVALNYQGLDPRLVGRRGSRPSHISKSGKPRPCDCRWPATLDALYSRA